MTTMMGAHQEWQGTKRQIWAAGLMNGFRVVGAETMLGIKRLVLPVSYWRTAELSFACRHLPGGPGARVLDVGSPKDLAAFLARYRGFEVVATDILREAVELSERVAAAQGISGTGAGRVKSEIQDGRRLPYPSDSFDAAFSVSVLEHIPEDGDSQAVRELVRVVRPGGSVVITVPFDEQFRETFVDGPVYERSQGAGELVFFERHYDDATLEKRLIRPSGATLTTLEHWGETLGVEKLLHRHSLVRNLLSPTEPLLASLFLRRAGPGRSVRRMAAFLTLTKPK